MPPSPQLSLTLIGQPTHPRPTLKWTTPHFAYHSRARACAAVEEKHALMWVRRAYWKRTKGADWIKGPAQIRLSLRAAFRFIVPANQEPTATRFMKFCDESSLDAFVFRSIATTLSRRFDHRSVDCCLLKFVRHIRPHYFMICSSLATMPRLGTRTELRNHVFGHG